MLSSIWRTTLFLVAAIILAPVANAGPARCIADAELEAAVGEQIRAGAFAVSTASFGERPMCSGLTVAQAIQRLRQQYLPAAAPPRPPRPTIADAPARRPVASAAVGAGTAPGMDVVLRYIGQHGFNRIEGRTFLQQPAVVSALTRAGVTPAVRRSLDRYAVGSPIDDWNGIVVAAGCVPHHCDTDSYRLLINPRSGVAALCLFRVSQASWYSGISPGAPIAAPRACPENPADAPSPVRSVLDLSASGAGVYGNPAYGTGSPAAPDDHAAPSADITGFLRFERPSWCESNALARIDGDAHKNGKASIGALGRVPFESGREEDWHILRAPVSAQWNGLTITAIEFYFVPESDIGFRRLRFREPPSRVGATLQRLGFGLSSGERIVETGGMEIQISVMPHDDGGTALDCSGA